MDAPFALTDRLVRAWTDAGSYQRGKAYARDGAIVGAERDGATLSAYCHGSLPYPYSVQARLSSAGIVNAACSCPVGDEGHCKHVVALLLTWLGHPDRFVPASSVEDALQGKSREELIVVIKQMLLAQPELRSLVLVAAGPATPPAAGGFDPQEYARQAAQVIRAYGGSWETARQVGRSLDQILRMGAAFEAGGQFDQAAGVYCGVARQCVTDYEMVADDEGDIADVLSQCIQGLTLCLAQPLSGATRAAAVTVVHAVFQFDLNYGGIIDGVLAPIVEHGTPEERAATATWLEGLLPATTGSRDDYSRREIGGWLLTLQQEALDDQAYLTLCQQTGRYEDAIERLLRTGRSEEVPAWARTLTDYELWTVADLLRGHRQAGLAVKLLTERLPTTKDSRIAEWLEAYHLRAGNQAAALPLSLARFELGPELSLYAHIKGLATSLDCWPETQAVLMQTLHQHPYGRQVLVDALLHDGLIAEAIAEVERPSPFGFSYHSAAAHLRVAAAAEKDFPEAALALYRNQAEQCIASKNRAAYEQAAALLVRVRKLHDDLGTWETWERYMRDLRARHHLLRALREELNAAGLE